MAFPQNHTPANEVQIEWSEPRSTVSEEFTMLVDVLCSADPTASAILTQDLPHQRLTGDSVPLTKNLPYSSARMSLKKNVEVRIIEEPASKELRFRYECEGDRAGSIPGASSTNEQKTYPTIQVFGLPTGLRAKAVVSCVTANSPYRAHPHRLVHKDAFCADGVCFTEFPLVEPRRIAFANLGIQCVRKKDIQASLKQRQQRNVDPFKGGFKSPTTINLNALRLCFQVFVENVDDPKRAFNIALTPVVSAVIYDKKIITELVICKLSHVADSVAGGLEMILLCEKVARDEVSVRFFELTNGVVTWEAMGESTVHKQSAICVRVPPYKSIHIDHYVQCFIQLRRNKTGETSEPLPFEYHPMGLGRRSRRPFDFLADILHVKPSADKDALNANDNVDQVPHVIDLVSPDQDTMQLIPVNDEPTMEAMDHASSDVDSRSWTSCEGSPPQLEIACNEADGLNELLEQVADMDEIYVIDRFISSDVMEHVETGFPGPMDEFYEECRRKALNQRPL